MLHNLPVVFIVMGAIAVPCELILLIGFVRKYPILGAVVMTALIITGVNALVTLHGGIA